MSSPPSAKSILQLYTQTLRTAKSFSSYNFREYFIRRTKSTFKEIQGEKDPARVSALYSEAARDLTSLKRSGDCQSALRGAGPSPSKSRKLQRERSDS
ncbi:hypothetical protein EDB84DRAFT_128645 [Lactarius hengduanensis]|nr:hypothetical protein EDB84DRAFT_128645 [Lactarius hengduanensis]